MIPLLLVLAQAAPVTPPTSPPSPLSASTYAELYAVSTIVTSTLTNSSRKDGALFLAQAGIGPIGLSVRALVSGLPGKFLQSDISTYQDAEAFLAVHYNLARFGEVTCGVNALAGYSLPLEGTGSPHLPRTMTAGVGVGCTSGGRTVWVDIGQCQALPGVCGMATWIWPVISNSKETIALVTIGDLMIGARQQRITRVSAAVKVKLWK